ncbi:transporter [Clostridia bacterium]|nr:transporter [Clostridia bacterium]
MKRFRLLVLVAVLVFALVASACSGESNSSGSTGSTGSTSTANSSREETGNTDSATGEKDLYVVATVYSGLDYFQDYKRAIEVAEKELDVTVEFVGPTDYNIEAMIAAIDQAIAKKPTGIIVMGWEETLNTVIDKAVDAGIFVTTTAVDLPDSKRNTFIGQGNYEAGRLAARYIVEKIGGKGEVAILRGLTLANVTERFEGFVSVLDEYPDIKLVADVDNKNDEVVASQQAASVIQQYPNLSAFLAADGISAPAVATSVREAGKAGDVTIVAYDRDPVVLDGIEEGVITATIVAGTPFEVYLAIQNMQRMKHSELQLSYDDKAAGVVFTPTYIDPGCTVVNQSNVEYFKRTNAD